MTADVMAEDVMTAQVMSGPERPRSLAPAPTNELLGTLRREFEELPTLRLTTSQATRLWSLDRTTCQCALNMLVDAHFLARDQTGRYVRVQALH